MADRTTKQPQNSGPAIRLQCDRMVRLTTLSNYRKGSRVPEADDGYAAEYLTKAAADDFQTDLKSRHALLRQHFRYKRLAMSVSEVDDAAASIVTPDFHYHLSLNLDANDTRFAVWNHCVSDLADTDILFGQPFAEVFGELFNCVQFASPAGVDVASFIDRVEDLESETMELDYGPDATSCVLTIDGADASIHVDGESIRIVRDHPAAPAVLLQTYFDLQRAMADEFDLPRLTSP